MSLISSSGFNGITDPDAARYITAVEAADGELLEGGVAFAISNFIVGCKLDGIWDAIKACCILAGARTLSGALVPLVGTAPTNFNFVAGDYNRETGLVGDGSTKYLDSNRNNNADPQNSNHLCVFVTAVNAGGGSRQVIGKGGTTGLPGSTHIVMADTLIGQRSRSNMYFILSGLGNSTGLLGISRALSSSFNYRHGGVAGVITNASQAPSEGSVQVYASDGVASCSDRLAFYSIGESLDLAALDTRVSALITAIGAAIP